jgi:L-rhamnose isomerase
MNPDAIERAYKIAQEQYAEIGVDTGTVMKILAGSHISVHCWQGDDVGGFETPGAALSGGEIQATGNYPGKSRNIDELRQDLEKVYSLVPGRHRLNLHAIYGEFGGGGIERNRIGPEHFNGWIDWGRQNSIKFDFNATCFSHPKAEDGFTLSHKENAIRNYWIEHVKGCREIAAYIGRIQDGLCIHNLWIPDGSKDITVDRRGRRTLLKTSLDEIYQEDFDSRYMRDAVESKLFGIGSEAFVVGSHEFYLGYSLVNKPIICLDTGHFHPTESVADKISAILQFQDELLLHVSRGVRWDSDHVAILNDDLRAIMEEVVRSDGLSRTHIGLDFFDASINRVGAWVTGIRATLKALLLALLEPLDILRAHEAEGNYFARLAMLEELKGMPFGAVWDYYCLKHDVPYGMNWIEEILRYDKEVTSKRGAV